jgi:hypothetical protein
MMLLQSPILEKGYTVVQLQKKRWYPLEVLMHYSVQSPNGFPVLYAIGSAFATCQEALAYCKHVMSLGEGSQVRQWAKLANACERYPDRCTSYRDEIQDITGRAPDILCYADEAWLYSDGFHCLYCNCTHEKRLFTGPTVEAVLEEAANTLYSAQRCCMALSSPALVQAK